MPRMARIVIPGIPHHITQRGNYQQDVFFSSDDRLMYLKILQEQSKNYDLSIDGYCLMTNHVHIIAVPGNEQSMSKAIGRTHFEFASIINYLHNRTGHLWQNRFYSCPMDEDHYFQAMAYVEMNPLRARIEKYPWNYKWSSAAAHIGHVENGILDLRKWQILTKYDEWKLHLCNMLTEEQIELIRMRTQVGYPLANDNFIKKMEERFGRPMRAEPAGRPWK